MLSYSWKTTFVKDLADTWWFVSKIVLLSLALSAPRGQTLSYCTSLWESPSADFATHYSLVHISLNLGYVASIYILCKLYIWQGRVYYMSINSYWEVAWLKQQIFPIVHWVWISLSLSLHSSKPRICIWLKLLKLSQVSFFQSHITEVKYVGIIINKVISLWIWNLWVN